MQFETGEFYSNSFESGTGQVTVKTTDMGDRVTPLPPHDRLQIDATIESGGHTYQVTVKNPVVNDPVGRYGTWWGVGYHVEHHGKSGMGSPKLPYINFEVAAFGLGDVTMDGQPVAQGVLVHIMTAEEGLANNAKLELSGGDPDAGKIIVLP